MMAQRLVYEGEALGYHALIPLRTFLIFEQDNSTIGIEAGGRTGMLQQDQRRQPHDFWFVRKQLQEQPAKSDCLFAQRRLGAMLGHVRGIALVEDKVDHGGNGREPLTALPENPNMALLRAAAAAA